MSAQPEFAERVKELADDYARIFAAGREAGYQAGLLDGFAKAKKIIDEYVARTGLPS
jgi:flagellar biosynthesis/type III secretory pathway protein FliH